MPSTANPKCENCANNCLIKKLGDIGLLSEVEKHKSTIRCKRGQHVFMEGIEVHYVMFLHSGLIKVYKPGLQNKRQILRFSKSGDILGHRGINTPTYPVSALALEDCVICRFPRDYFLQLIRDHNELAIMLMFIFADELTQSETRERNLAHLSVRGKVADTLLRLKDSFGIDEDKMLKIFLSRQDIAEYAGTTKEQVSKALSDLNHEMVIKVNSKRIQIINELKLSALRKS